MRRAVSLLGVILLVMSQVQAQEIKLPPEIHTVPGAWVILAPEIVSGGKAKFRLDPGLQEVRLDLLFPPEVASQARGKVLQASQPGRYRVEVWNALKDVPSDIATSWVVVVSPSPVPVPPGPEPPPPVPPPDPTPAGLRTVILLRESAEDTPSMGRLINSLQAGKAREYLKSKGHSAFVLDDDAVNSDGQPSELVAKWKAFLDVPLPAVAILDEKGALLFKISLAEGATADEIISWVKAKGG